MDFLGIHNSARLHKNNAHNNKRDGRRYIFHQYTHTVPAPKLRIPRILHYKPTDRTHHILRSAKIRKSAYTRAAILPMHPRVVGTHIYPLSVCARSSSREPRAHRLYATLSSLPRARTAEMKQEQTEESRRRKPAPQ